jgi:hypothetical protein
LFLTSDGEKSIAATVPNSGCLALFPAENGVTYRFVIQTEQKGHKKANSAVQTVKLAGDHWSIFGVWNTIRRWAKSQSVAHLIQSVARLNWNSMFERKHETLASFPTFLGRVGWCLLIASSILAVALVLGVLGYRFFGQLDWIDALLNAAMILTGMGPVSPMNTVGGKLFATGYALFSGLLFMVSFAVVISPIFHRILHKFHLDDEDVRDDGEPKTTADEKTQR